MKKKMVRALNVATGQVLIYSPSYKFGVEPKHLFAPPNFTDVSAFDRHFFLRDAVVGSTVFIEWPMDRFCTVDSEANKLIAGSTVWRKAEVLEHIEVSSKD